MSRWLAVVIVGLALSGCAGRRDVAASKPGIDASAARGRAIFTQRCAVCHASDGSGSQLGPSLRRERVRATRERIVNAIEYPVPPMPKLWPAQMTQRDVADVAAYVEQL